MSTNPKPQPPAKHSPTDPSEIRARVRRNRRERAVIDAYLAKGWEVITRGKPCFMARKKGQKVRFVWVLRKTGLGNPPHLDFMQKHNVSICQSLGLDARIENPFSETQPFCAPDGPAPIPTRR